MRIITRNIWILSVVSLLTDVASEMLYPVMPVYLASINFSIFLIGVLEGCAEAFAGLSKGYFGKLSDNAGRRLPFVQLGYLLSAISKPMMGLWTFVWWIFFARFTDRIGKGIRTGARDALLSDEATPETKGQVFGFHRAMDTLGAVAGPAVALLFLYCYPGQYRWLFFAAFVPGIIAIGFTLLIREKKTERAPARQRPGFFAFIRYFRTAPAQYRLVVAGLLLFALINSSDVFLLLRIREATGSDTTTIGIYIFYNLVFALLSYPLGLLADRIGMRKVLAAGFVLYALAYGCMAFGSSVYMFGIAFLFYGIYGAATEGVGKAWLTNIAGKNDTATAIGTYTAFQSICTLIASSLTGLLWLKAGSTAALFLPALIAIIIACYFQFSASLRRPQDR